MIVWLWPYWPVMYVDLDGQQSGKDAKLFVNVVPRAASSVFTFGMTRIDSTVWSSVISTTMFGRVCVCWTSDVAEEASAAESARSASVAAKISRALAFIVLGILPPRRISTVRNS